ncbi:MAG: response regulator, partial [Firmicutes bacterium]|nr:response regulator [Bacillota bacterium]
MSVAEEQLPKIMHIDDDEELLHLFYLSFEKYLNIKQSLNLEEAIDLIKEEEFDAVITDYEMPGFNGLDVLKAVKEINPDLPVIFYTG